MAEAGKIVAISALGGTYLRQPFGGILDLVPKCEKIIQLHAICKMCAENASFTLRTSKSTQQTLIGGEEDYIPVCRECFVFMTRQQKIAEDKQEKENELRVEEDESDKDI